ARVLLLGALLLAQLGQALGRAKAAIGATALDEDVGVLAIDRAALGLPVRARGAAHIRPLVPVQADPAQRPQDRGLAVGARASAIGVLDAQDERTALLAGK